MHLKLWERTEEIQLVIVRGVIQGHRIRGNYLGGECRQERIDALSLGTEQHLEVGKEADPAKETEKD